MLEYSNNPDQQSVSETPFILHSENMPKHLHEMLKNYKFRKCTLDEILNSEDITQDSWPGVVPSSKHDLIAQNLVNAPMCAAFDVSGKMIAYTRLLWGYDNQGKPEIHSHMTAVSSFARDNGLGESLKWLARQVALEFPIRPVDQLSVTFDNMQGRVLSINLNKLGMVCGSAGGVFRHNIYREYFSGKQYRGNFADRFQARWYLNSDWVLAHLEEKVNLFSLEQVKTLPYVVQYEYFELTDQNSKIKFPTPVSFNADLSNQYIVLPAPSNWNEFLELNEGENLPYVNEWRQVHRLVLDKYHKNGYTTVFQVSDSTSEVNLQVLAKDFDPNRPPLELLKH